MIHRLWKGTPIHLECAPTDTPDLADHDVQLGVAPEQITIGLLERYEQFFCATNIGDAPR